MATSTLVLVLCPSVVLAFNRGGHMVTAAIAHDDLAREDEAVITRVARLLRGHPQFESWRAAVDEAGLVPADANRRLFMLAARWPDDVRGRGDGFDEPAAHFINLPYWPDVTFRSLGQRLWTQVPRAPENLLTVYRRNLAILAGSAGDAQKAVALCWIFHLTGDAHQPLHAINLFSDRFPPPQGDRGGTRFYVRAGTDRSTVSLHTVWDNVLIGSDRFQAAGNKAIALRTAPGMDRNHMPELAPRFAPGDQDHWVVQESHQLAKRVAYLDGALVGSADKTDGTVVPPGYLVTARATAARQAVLAGYRLSDVLRYLFSSQP